MNKFFNPFIPKMIFFGVFYGLLAYLERDRRFRGLRPESQDQVFTIIAVVGFLFVGFCIAEFWIWRVYDAFLPQLFAWFCVSGFPAILVGQSCVRILARVLKARKNRR